MAAIPYTALKNAQGLGVGWAGPGNPPATGVIESEKDLRALLGMRTIPYDLINAATRGF